jgi:hypothetical protein
VYRAWYLIFADLVETRNRGFAENSVGKTIDTLLCNDPLILGL